MLGCVNDPQIVHWANMGPIWVLSAQCGPHVGPMNLAVRVMSGEREEKERVMGIPIHVETLFILRMGPGPCALLLYDDVIRWKHFPCHWPFVQGIYRSPMNSPHKGQWRRALMFSLICAWINGWVDNREAGDLRRHRAHYDVTVMDLAIFYKITVFVKFIVKIIIWHGVDNLAWD